MKTANELQKNFNIDKAFQDYINNVVEPTLTYVSTYSKKYKFYPDETLADACKDYMESLEYNVYFDGKGLIISW